MQKRFAVLASTRLRRGACAVVVWLAAGPAWGQQPGTLLWAAAQNPQSNERAAPVAPPEVLSIPPVAERPLGADDGPRVHIAAFELVVDPVLAASATPAVLDAARALLAAKVAAQPDAGMTIGQMEAAAVEVTQHLRSSGFALAAAYLPTQSVSGGRVQIATLPGALGEIVAEGNDRYSLTWLSKPFKDIQGRPVNVVDLEGAILQVRDYPGVSPAAVLSPGKEVGTSDLTLRVSEWPFDYGLTGDNYGSKFNGQYRARAWAAWNNPLGHADRLYVDVLQAFDPTENTYGSASYMTRLGNPALTGGIEFSVSSFDIDEDIRATFGGEPINGEATIISVPFRFEAIRSRDLTLGLSLTYSHKESSFDDLAASGGAINREDKEDVLGAGFDLIFVDRVLGTTGVTDVRGGYDYGDLSGDEAPPTGDVCETTRQGGDGDCAGGSFGKAWIQISRLQYLFKANSLQFKGYYQDSSDMLVSLEQAALGGFYSVRAYPTSQELVDKGGFASLEWHVDIHELLTTRPQNWDLTAFALVDYADGEDNNALAGDLDSVEMGGWGGGMQFQYRFGTRWAFEARVDVSTETSDYEGLLPDDDDDDPRYWGWLSLSYR